jgi:ABC-type nickel/cobalt efflux system permease component RcnA
MFMHVLSGATLILFGALVLKTSGAMTLENSGIVLERFSYGLLAVVGIFISGKIIHEFKKGHRHSHDSPDRADLKSLVFTALAVGIVPCPGAALILLFSLTLGIFFAGLWAMLFIALGMAITSSMFAIGALVFKRAFLSMVDGNDRVVAGVYIVISLSGAMCIALLGLLLLIGSF